jgi:hypothetical protein
MIIYGFSSGQRGLPEEGLRRFRHRDLRISSLTRAAIAPVMPANPQASRLYLARGLERR